MASHGAWKGRTSWVKIPPRKTRHVRFGAASADTEGAEEDQTSVDTADQPTHRSCLVVTSGSWLLSMKICQPATMSLWDAETLWYLTMFLCLLWDLSVFLSCSRRICLCVSPRDLLPIYKTREHRTLTMSWLLFLELKNGVCMPLCLSACICFA
ncbi:uncharacterized protein LOC144902297 [Branchiostoma floridae x Branchiostoma belcheri]